MAFESRMSSDSHPQSASKWRRIFVTTTGIERDDGGMSVEGIDIATKSIVSLPQMSMIGRAPQPGDVWLASRDGFGPWVLSSLVTPSSMDHGFISFREVVDHLIKIGLIRFEPWDAPDGSVERPYMSYLGQFRLFAPGCAPTGWIRCNGSTHKRSRYRELWEKASASLGAGDGSTTFTSPTMADVGPGQWYICAE